VNQNCVAARLSQEPKVDGSAQEKYMHRDVNALVNFLALIVELFESGQVLG
jgi:hypothetical protein